MSALNKAWLILKYQGECPECGKNKDDLDFRILSRDNYGVMCTGCYNDKSVVGLPSP